MSGMGLDEALAYARDEDERCCGQHTAEALDALAAEVERLRAPAAELRYLWRTDALPESTRDLVRDESMLLARALDELTR